MALNESSLWKECCTEICKDCFALIDSIEKISPWKAAGESKLSLLERIKQLPFLQSVAAGSNDLFFNVILTLWHQVKYGGWTNKENADYIASIYAINKYELKDVYFYAGTDEVWERVRAAYGDAQISMEQAVEGLMFFFPAHSDKINRMTVKESNQ